jgi:hypothetical protein
LRTLRVACWKVDRLHSRVASFPRRKSIVLTVFARIALFSIALLVATAGLGLWIGDLHGQEDLTVLRWGTVHRLSGVFSGLMVVLVNSITVTYFIGTGRWCREVVDTYGLADSYVDRSKRLKRKAFPWAVSGMLAVIAAVALGGAADPATGRSGTEQWVNVHLIGSLTCVAVIGYCYQAQVTAIRGQQRLIDDVLAAVREIRVARGLEIETAAVAAAGQS